MKNVNIDVHGVYSLSNTGGIEVHIEEGYDPFIFWRYSIIDTEPTRQREGHFSGLVVCGFIKIKLCAYNGIVNINRAGLSAKRGESEGIL